MKVLSVFGTRPEAIKMGPILKELKSRKGVASYVCITGQHREMVDPFLEFFEIEPDFDLKIMKQDMTLTLITTEILVKLEQVLSEIKPDLLLVQGDTASATAAALAGFYQRIPIAHVEAGLRTGNQMLPWPEEGNRKMISALATYHFAPTKRAKENLLREKIPPNRVFITGNTVVDSLFFALKKRNPKLEPFPFLDKRRKTILVTGHRRESFGAGFQSICKAIKRLSEREDVQIVYPVHLNPNVQLPVRGILGDTKNVYLIEPLGYLDFVSLMNLSYLILTDSGGIQEEAPSLGKPVLIMREVTEREETVFGKSEILVGTDEDKIVQETEKLLDNHFLYKKMSRVHHPYGNGTASKKIVNQILREYEAKV